MKNRETNDSGIALIVVLLLMLVFTIMMLGFYFQTTGEQQVAASDRDNTVTFYAAQGGLENMSSALADLFTTTASPTPAQITARAGAAYQVSIPVYNGVGSLASQQISFPVYSITNLPIAASINPPISACTPSTTVLCSTPGIIPGNGPLAGLEGILTPFMLTVVAAGPNNTEVKMQRQVQEVAVPVFQYGIFSQSDLSFFAGPNFGFGGRTATNGNLFLAEGGGTLTLNDKVTAFLSVIRSQLSNGLATATTSYNTPVDVTIGSAGGCPMPTCPSCPTTTCRAMGLTDGSVTGGPGSGANSNWQTLSMNTYKGYIRSGSTGVKQLNLALALANQPPIDMIERPPVGESVTSVVGQQRFFNQASVRILLSDTPSQITSLPGVTSSAPYPLAEGANSGMSNVIQRTSSTSAYYLPTPDSCHPPMAESPGWTADNDYMLKPGTTLLGGYIKIEIQLNSNPGTWQDVTQEVLSTGISRDVQTSGTGACTKNISILHLEEARPYPPMGAPTVSSPTSGGSLTASKTYYYVVTALGTWGEIPGTEQKASTATTSSKDTITVTWTAYPGATGYNIYHGTSSGGENQYVTVGAVTSYTDRGTGFTAGTPPTTLVMNTTTAATTATNFVPINIYDPREGEVRDSNSYTTVSINGIMNLLEVDVGNLQQWLNGTLCTASTVPTSCTSGTLALNNSGYILYVSDRRGNCNQAASATAGGPCTANDTGEYGYEDTINPSSGTGAPNGTLDTGEDVDGDGVLETYGGIAHPINASNVDTSGSTKYPTGATTTLATFMASLTNPSTPDAAPLTRITSSQAGWGYYEAQKNPVLFFRRAVRLVNGTLGNLPPYSAAHMATCPNAQSPAAFPAQGGFSVAAENPVYIQGDYNASNSVGAFSPDPSNKCHVPAAVYADAVTLLSNAWTDSETFTSPTNVGSRPGTSNTWFRVAVIAGKNISFPLPNFTIPAAPPQDFGTDGGTHNFLRYIENWGSTLNYLGSMVSFYYAQQATGVYKCCNTVYSPPTRNYAYDSDFTKITSMPPGTPRFTDVNALSYQQSVLSTQ